MPKIEVSPTSEGLLLSPVLTIDPGWVDYNGHLNQVYYGALFDQIIEATLVSAGLGYNYIQKHNRSQMMVESHTCFIRELFKTDTVRVQTRILDVDEKRLHMFGELIHATDGWLSATQEWMFLHLDMSQRRVTPWPADIRANLEAMKAGVRAPRHKNAGRSIGIVHKG